MLDHVPLIAGLTSFAGILVLGAGETPGRIALRAAGLLLIAAGVALFGLHAIVAREIRWGRRLSSQHYGVGAQLRGLAMVIGAAGIVLAATWEIATPHVLERLSQDTNKMTLLAVFLALAAMFLGSAMLVGRSSGPQAMSFVVSLPSRVVGFLMMIGGAVGAAFAMISLSGR
jgi:hypothetical protein